MNKYLKYIKSINKNLLLCDCVCCPLCSYNNPWRLCCSDLIEEAFGEDEFDCLTRTDYIFRLLLKKNIKKENAI